MSKYSILPSSPQDIPTIADFLWTSKQPLTINRILFQNWPNEVAQRALYTSAVKSGSNDPSRESWKVVDEESGEIVGHVVLKREKAVVENAEAKEIYKQNESADTQVPKGLDPEVYKAVREAVEEIDRDFHSFDHLELTHIFVAMAHRNQGIGSQLVEFCLDKAKAEGLPLTVGSEPQAHAFFQKFGFEDMRYADIDLEKWAPKYCGFGLFRLWGMITKI